LLNISLFASKRDTMNQHKIPKPKAYLDTSVISALFDDRNPERKSLTEHFFQTMGFYEIYLSEITVLEINRTQDIELLNKMKSVILLKFGQF